ncbi:hypothetical protein CG747_43200 [Streptomyces sp. CB02959]|uniref:serine/threonine-protein kinase n=1 Tax=Streptomyces sp. CB02959 TaxID=2020330 RepID=UPI000C27E4B9|nr:serine/threonine-protein kinase [Streptomyces sp. CB02959]PJN32292.1 hypothetical protein CG747_43200 [Streptomyces sp. CB02959]
MTTSTTPSLHCPDTASDYANQCAGSPATWALIRDRHDHQLWQVHGPHMTVAVKVASGESAARALVREAAALRTMPPGGIRVLHTADDVYCPEPRAWLITPWADGPTTWDACKKLRDNSDSGRDEARRAAVELCMAVGRLHTAGWVHCDLRPHHAVHTTAGVRLLSCTGASRIGNAVSAAYLGGLVHLLSPRLTAALESTAAGLVLDPDDEIYTLAAGLWWAATTTWPLAYADAGFDSSTMTAVALRRAIATAEIPLAQAAEHPWSEFLAPLSAAMAQPPGSRPSAFQLADQLKAVPLT